MQGEYGYRDEIAASKLLYHVKTPWRTNANKRKWNWCQKQIKRSFDGEIGKRNKATASK